MHQKLGVARCKFLHDFFNLFVIAENSRLFVRRVKLDGSEAGLDGLFNLMVAVLVKDGGCEMPHIIAVTMAPGFCFCVRDGFRQPFVPALSNERVNRRDTVLHGNLCAGLISVSEIKPANLIIEVGVDINEAREDKQSLRVNYPGGADCVVKRAQGRDLPVFDENVRRFDCVFEADLSVANQHFHGRAASESIPSIVGSTETGSGTPFRAASTSFRPCPVIRRTICSFRSSNREFRSFFNAATVADAAGSANTLAFAARSRCPSKISSSVTVTENPPLSRTAARAMWALAGMDTEIESAIVCGRSALR